LGLGNNTFLGLTDTPDSFSTGRILFEGTNAVDHADLFVFTNGNLGIGTTSPYARLSVAGSVVAANYIATTSTSTLRGLTLSTLNCMGSGNGGKLTTDASGNLICAADNGGDGSGAYGALGEVQFTNGSGVFTASSNFTWSTTTNTSR
jgi:hypothetical protein